MRIAFICADPGVPVFGHKGCSVHVQEMVRALIAQGARVQLFAARLGGNSPPDWKGIAIHELSPLPGGEPTIGEQRALAQTNPALQARLKREGPFDLVYERYSLWSWAGMAYARDQGIPGLLEVNAPLIEEQQQHRGLVDRPGAEKVAESVFASASALIAVSREVAEYVQRFRPPGPVHVIPNGVNPDHFPPNLEPSLPSPPGTFTVGFLGTLKPWHGLLELAEAFARFHSQDPCCRLLVVGDGPGRSKLAADLSSRGLTGKAHWTGAVAAAAVPGLLASMDAGVAPYPQLADFYFSPLKVFEYMAAGLAVVASGIGQLVQLIQHEENGLLCPPGRPDLLAKELQRLRSCPELRARLGRSARQTVLRQHSWQAVAEQVLQLAGLRSRSSNQESASSNQESGIRSQEVGV